MKVLGIECTAHTFGVGIFDSEKGVLANEKVTYKGYGIHPREAAELHLKEFDKVLLKALEKANISLKDIDLIAVSSGPGLLPTLKLGNYIAVYLGKKLNKPVIGVNHIVAHNEFARYLAKAKDPLFVYVSGANTQFLAIVNNSWFLVGETLDMGVGNLIDKVARDLGLEFPGGPKIEELAKKGKNLIELPYTIKGLNLQLGGIYTYIKRIKDQYSKEDIAYSLQEWVFALILEIAERAMHMLDKKELILTGGVACNNRLNDMAEQMAKENNFKFYRLPCQYLTDNGAMIAYLGYYWYSQGIYYEPKPRPYWRIWI
ncbi:NEQ493 [Nanoarchaeum equitans Kin4-M]|uniref:tRNA N6-adenosine threonylcarbamoyltransferase n=1 Tax=Nanoarchaeum equitans (strain Kin4-M) TaxID=228908 RepID=KAE1_NANEQ|nr:RecName: Full=tRNA N6-adenosine threonylcarbamoyltransferase; AltName: Full=N6-L-threonylcarbamoyladenine synthase; Short=t(6)A synthase; AltName: Full=t(6)A37 threonylcarbamoyladenosine biosynthesis protein Kae1; AltName: Full=tRNA threonylcarbamoyladenosine biosynthesis protein Kae1 [Nanoarchaeum equitans Kin4-M]AAR39335.1 NEQ493 [Nanoarchaeum equitans Kin4-M]